MRLKDKIVYGIAGFLAFLPLIGVIVGQSIFALQTAYDSKLVIDAEDLTVNGILVYDGYNDEITDLGDSNNIKPALWSIIEATDTYALIDFHGGEVNEIYYDISGVQFTTEDGTRTELLRGVVYLRFKNVDMAQSTWLTDFIEDTNTAYENYFQQPQGTISFVWVKIIAASAGTLIGMLTVTLIILRKSTKALVKRYWRISVLVALAQGTIILGLITWLIADIFQVFAAATVGWALFLGAEKFAKIKGYLETAVSTEVLPETLPDTAVAEVQSSIEAILARYRK